jgi:hypothetical protein
MATDAYALGKTFDVAVVAAVQDLDAGNVTGNRVNLRHAGICSFVLFADASSDGADLNCTVREHDAATSGTSQDLAVVTDWFKKDETTLDGDETWTRTSQTAAAAISAVAGSAEVENLWVIEVRSEQLSDGFDWISLNIADVTTAAKYGGVLAILTDLKIQRAPERLAATQ